MNNKPTPFYDRSKQRLNTFVAAELSRSLKLLDTFGTTDVYRLCDRLVYVEDIISRIARVAGATPEEIHEIIK